MRYDGDMKGLSEKKLERRKLIIELTMEFFAGSESAEVENRVASALIYGRERFLEGEDKSNAYKIKANLEA